MLNAIFDFNGTMFFDETFQEKAWQQYMTEKLGRRITPEEFQTWVHGRNTGDTLEYFFGRPFTQQEADEEEEAEETIYRAFCRQSPDYKLADGLVEFLDFLAAHKIPRTIATASCGNNVRFFFDTLVCRERAKRKKTTEFPRRSTINKNGMYCSRTRVQYMPFLVIREAAVKEGS